MKHTWRWFGPKDRITLNEIRQTGATGIVTALHHIPIGEVWPVEEIVNRKNVIEKAGLEWSVVESVPVHEDIKKQKPGYQNYINTFRQTLKNLGYCGIKTVCYNFMPVLDWSRTNLVYRFEDGSEVTRFDYHIFVAYDVFILERKDAELNYPEEVIEKAKEYYSKLDENQISELEKTILLGLPGSGETFTPEQLKLMISEYDTIDVLKLKENLFSFIREVVPAAEEAGIKLAIHPDDPPWSLFGLPRIVGNEQDITDILKATDSAANGLTFCTGSLGAGYFNNVGELAEKFAPHIYFAHLRNVKRDERLNFNEDYFFNGDVDMFRVMKALVKEESRRKKQGMEDEAIPLRPDHGNQMLGDIGMDNYPGYSLYGRMKNLSEIRGLEIGVRMSMQTPD